jgi:hypothetical protein
VRCLSCNGNLTDREASRKFDNWRDISNPEQRYIMLCDKCIPETGLEGVINPLASDEPFQDESEVEIDPNEDVENLDAET